MANRAIPAAEVDAYLAAQMNAVSPKKGLNKGNAGKGRPKGAQNKVTKELKDMILQALDNAGGVKYLQERAKDPRTAGAFLTLVGKVLPLQVTGEGGGPVQTVARIELVAVSADKAS